MHKKKIEDIDLINDNSGIKDHKRTNSPHLIRPEPAGDILAVNAKKRIKQMKNSTLSK